MKEEPTFPIMKPEDVASDADLEKLDELDYDRPHVYVATPAYDGKVDSCYAQCLGNTAWNMGLFGLRLTASTMGNSAFIEMSRNLFCKFILEKDELRSCTHLFFVDGDLEWESASFVGLVTSCTEERPVVAGVYPRRQQRPFDFPAQWWPHPDYEESGEGEKRLWLDDDGWLKCRRVPTGFLCIRRNIIEEMAEDAFKARTHDYGVIPWLFHTGFDPDARFVGEDFGWCDDYVARYERPIDVWPCFDFVHGGIKGNYEEFLAAKVKEYEIAGQGPRRLGGKRG